MSENLYPVFLSCGTPENAAQAAFLAEVETCLRTHGCDPQTVGRTRFSGRQPVQAARDLIGACRGAVIIAFERTRILDGVEGPGGPEPTKIANESLPTVWNHMEAAMAYAQRVPLLTLVQPGVKRQGMLSKRLEWVALERELTPELLRGDEFRQMFDEWLALVKTGRSQPAAGDDDLETKTLPQLLGMLKAKQLYGLATAIVVVLAAVSGAAFKIGEWTQRMEPAKAAASR